MGSAAGVLKTAAARIGVTVAEYQKHLNASEKWCTGCKDWHDLNRFQADKSRSDGRTAQCGDARKREYRRTYQPRPRPGRGRRFAPARDGDVLQARGRVNYLITAELIPAPNDLPCADCGHVWTDGERRHEYDHYLGYAAEHHEDVESVCTTCHHAREDSRRSAA